MSADSSPVEDARLVREGVEALEVFALASWLPSRRSRDTLRELAVAPRGSVAGISGPRRDGASLPVTRRASMVTMSNPLGAEADLR